jgi:exodeoxyribonuclease VII large subunit
MSDLGSWGAAPAAKPAVDSPDSTSSLGASRASSQESPWPVSRLSQTLKDFIDRLGMLWVEGEIAKISFTNNMFAQLRDLQSENSVEIHSWNIAKIDPTIKQGDRVVALIKPNFWPKNGKLSMQVFEMRKVGLGELLERIERLRAQLTAEGLTQVKQPLPYLPNLIGLITGKDSDAEKDVLQNARLRWPEVQFKVIHTPVQGDKAAPQIIAAIKELDADPAVDVIVIARGGGSFLDLLVFSDEALVRAAAATCKPLVSAIGHENDRPVLDDVADLRASTPTDAAKRVVPDVQEERLRISQLLNRLYLRVGGQINQGLDLVAQLRSRPILANPHTFITLRQEQLDRHLADARSAFGTLLSHELLRLEHLKQQVRSLSPQSTLDRGYAVVRTDEGQVITDAAAVATGTKIKVRVAKGEIRATSN